MRLYIALTRTYKAVPEKDQRNIRGYGLNTSEFGVLELLYNKGPHPLQRSAEKSSSPAGPSRMSSINWRRKACSSGGKRTGDHIAEKNQFSKGVSKGSVFAEIAEFSRRVGHHERDESNSKNCDRKTGR